jgi:hypothetical protein
MVLAYRDSGLLSQLTDWLSRGSSSIIVHVDQDVDQKPFFDLANPKAKFVATRFSCPWGSWGRVAASLEMLREAVESGSSHIALLSEDTFPLHDPEAIPSLLEKSGVGVWMDGERMGSPHKPITRLSRISNFRGDPRKQSKLLRILQNLPFTYERVDYRRHLGDMIPWAGDSWWILTNKTAKKILDYANSNPDLIKFFSKTWIPDEHFFQTVVALVDPGVEFRGTPILADWSSGNSKFPPYFFDRSSIDTLRNGKTNFLFARKLEKVEPKMTEEIYKIWEND